MWQRTLRMGLVFLRQTNWFSLEKLTFAIVRVFCKLWWQFFSLYSRDAGLWPPFKHHLIVSCASQCSSNDDSKCEIFYRPNDTEPLTRSSALEVWINPFPNTDAVFQKAYMIVFRMHSFSGVHFQKYFLEGIIEPAIPEASVHKDTIFRNPNLLSLLKQAEKISITYTDFETSHIKQQTFFNGNGHETSWFDFNNVFYSTFWNFTVNTTSILDTVFYSEWGDQNEFGTAFLMKKILDQSNPYFISFWSEILTSYGTCVTNWTTLPELSQFPPENIQPPFIVYSQDQGPRMCGGHKMAEMISISVLWKSWFNNSPIVEQKIPPTNIAPLWIGLVSWCKNGNSWIYWKSMQPILHKSNNYFLRLIMLWLAQPAAMFYMPHGWTNILSWKKNSYWFFLY